MSQAGSINGSGGGGGGPITALLSEGTGSTNATPNAGVIRIFGSDATPNDTDVNNDAGLVLYSGAGGTGSTDLVQAVLTNRSIGEVTTTDGTETQILSFILDATASTYFFRADFVAYNTTDNAGAVFTATYGASTDGATSTELGIEVASTFVPMSMAGTSIDIQVAGANAVSFTVTGLAAKTINWKVLMTYITTIAG